MLWLLLCHPPTRSELEQRVVEQDLYSILNVTETATTVEIKKSFRKLAQKYHPDKAGADRAKESEERFRSIADAYEVLSNDRDRREYDQRRLMHYSNTGSRHPGMEDEMEPHYAYDHESMRDMYLELLMNKHSFHDNQFFQPSIIPFIASGQVIPNR